MEQVSKCRVCNSTRLKPFFDLGEQPLANSLLDSPDQEDKKYPLSLSWCGDCFLVQLNYTVNPEVLFSKYLWVTGTSRGANEFKEVFCNELLKKTELTKDDLVVDIASNDGTFLVPFRDKGYKVLGIDPAENIAEIARKNNIPTECWFFGLRTAEQLIKQYKKPKIVFARNVLPHVVNTRDFVKGINLILPDDGVAAVEVHYAKEILEGLHYDSIYHEHLCYFTVKSIERLFNDCRLYIFDIKDSPISGGSIILYLRKRKAEETPRVQRYRDCEIKDKTNEVTSWEDFAKRSFEHKKTLLEILEKDKSEDSFIIGYGASARSSTMLNFCGINSKVMPMIADLNDLKNDKYTAGSHIKIVKPEVAMRTKPDTIFILAWNFKDEIIKYLKEEFGFNGKYVIPLPYKPEIK